MPSCLRREAMPFVLLVASLVLITTCSAMPAALGRLDASINDKNPNARKPFANYPLLQPLSGGKRDLFASTLLHRANATASSSKSRRRAHELSSSICDLTDLIGRVQVCLTPFSRWNGYNWNDAYSVQATCNSVCQKTLDGMTGDEWQCLKQFDAALEGILKSMCVQEPTTQQYCGEPYAVGLLFDECPKMDAANCKALATCHVVDGKCRPNYESSIMSRMCTPCLGIFTGQLSASGVSERTVVQLQKVLDTECVKVGDTYCASMLADPFWSTGGSTNLFTLTTPQNERLCSDELAQSCYVAANGLASIFFDLQSEYEFSDCIAECNELTCQRSCSNVFMTKTRKMARYRAIDERLCTRQAGNGSLCVPLPTGSATTESEKFAACFEETNVQDSPCLDSCNASLKTIENWGCCAETINEILTTPFATPAEAVIDPAALTKLRSSTVYQCNGPTRTSGAIASCAMPVSRYFRKRSFTMNLLWDRFVEASNGSWTAVDSSIAKDIASMLGTTATGITDVKCTRSSSTITLLGDVLSETKITGHATDVSITIRAPSNETSAGLAAAFDRRMQERLVSLPTTASVVSATCVFVGGCHDYKSLVQFHYASPSSAAMVIGPSWLAMLVTIVLTAWTVSTSTR